MSDETQVQQVVSEPIVTTDSTTTTKVEQVITETEKVALSFWEKVKVFFKGIGTFFSEKFSSFITAIKNVDKATIIKYLVIPGVCLIVSASAFGGLVCHCQNKAVQKYQAKQEAAKQKMLKENKKLIEELEQLSGE